jgi:RNA polymerase sigma factor (sigma-70 family)
MFTAELLDLVKKKDKTARKEVFETNYSKFAAIALRYAKNQAQSEEMLMTAFHNALDTAERSGPQSTCADISLEKEFIKECVTFIRNIRSEYYVSSTVYANAPVTAAYDLFDNPELIDFNSVDNDLLLKAIQQLVPAQRLIFNLHVVDGYSLDESAAILEASALTAKSNLEKARFHLQKNIEKSLKTARS